LKRGLGLDPDTVLYLFGRIEYKDIFFPETSLHYFEWCVAAVPANPITGAFSRMYEERMKNSAPGAAPSMARPLLHGSVAREESGLA
jgi:hypothetical protein